MDVVQVRRSVGVVSKRPTKAEMDERVKVDLPPDEFVEAILETGPQPDETRVSVHEHAPGDWWAECLVCGDVWIGNPDRRAAEQTFGRHSQREHADAKKPPAE
jgi:hypothetical protein